MRNLIALAAVFWQVLNISAYAETGNRTASGVWPVAGVTCAADHLPFGSRVTLPDGRTWIVQDSSEQAGTTIWTYTWGTKRPAGNGDGGGLNVE